MTLKIRLVHTADLHLGSSFATLPELAEILQQEQMQQFLQIIEYCRQQKTDLLLLAGDLFEQAVPAPALLAGVRDALRLIPETEIFIAPGNHDPVCPDSPWVNDIWPENTHIFRSGLEKVELGKFSTCVYGAAFCSSAAVSPLVEPKEFDLDKAKINILLLHGDLVGTGQSSAYNPIDRNWLQNSGFDYVALGHIHQGHTRPEKFAHSNTFYAYSGCPAGRGFDETGGRGIIFGDLKKIGQEGAAGRGLRTDADLRQVEITARRFQHLHIDITGCQNQDEIYGEIKEQMEKTGSSWTQDLYKISLTGALEDDIQPLPAVLRSRLEREVFFCKIIDNTTKAYNLPAIAGEHSLLGAFVRSVLEQDEPDWNQLSDEKARILQTGLQAFTGEVAYREID